MKYLSRISSFLAGQRLLLLLCLTTLFTLEGWGTTPTLSDLSFSTESSVRIVNEDFESLSTTSAITTSAAVATTNQTAFGVFNCIYNNQTYNTRAIVSNANGFSTKSMALSSGGGSPVIMHITTPTWGTKGAFRVKTTKTSTEYIGFYGEISGTIFAKAKSTVYVQNNAGAISIHNGMEDKSAAWVSAGSYDTDIIDICVIYNTTNSSATYGSSITLGSKKAHIYVNGTCVMNGESPKDFSLNQTTLTSFRVAPLATSGNKAYVDDVQIWNALPTAAAASCANAPTVTAGSLKGSVSTCNSATAQCSSGISNIGGSGCSLTSYGFAVGTSTGPIIGNALTGTGKTYEVGSSIDASTSFEKLIDGLSEGTTYYVRPYATNGAGTAYGTEFSFTTLTLSSISVATAPTKVKYLVGDNFDPTGLVITRTYTNSTSDTYTYANHTAEFSFDPSTSLTSGTSKAITITYGGQTTTTNVDVYTVTVNKVNMSGTAISNASVTASCSGRTLSQSVSTSNYKFNSWNVTDGGVTVSDNTITGTPSGNVTINAKFHDPIHVTWKVNNGAASGTPTDEVKYGTKVTDLPSTPADNTLNNCANKFMGWSTHSWGATPKGTGTGEYDDLFTDEDDSPDLTQDTTFYAVFAERQGPAENTVIWSEDWTGVSGAQTAPSAGATVYPGASITYSMVDGTGTSGNKGNTSVQKSDNYAGGTAPELQVGKGNTTPGYWAILNLPKVGAAELTLQFKRNNYTLNLAVSNSYAISYVSGSGADTYTYTIACKAASTFTLTMTAGSSNNVRVDDIVLKVKTPSYSNYVTQCASEQVRVTYNANGGSAPSCAGGVTTKSASYTVCSTEPTKTGYDFGGWNDGTSTYNAGATGYNLQSNTTFAAQWTAHDYTITYKDQGDADYSGTNLASLPGTHTYNSATALVNGSKGNGYRFDGWYTTSACTGDPVTSLGATDYTDDITLYAKWTVRHEIIFDVYGGSTTTIYRADDENIEDAVGVGTKPSDPDAPTACSTKTFMGWVETEIDDETDTRPGDLTNATGKVTADKHYYATWALVSGTPIDPVEDNSFTTSGTETYCGMTNGMKQTGDYILKNSIWTSSNMSGVQVKIKVYHLSNSTADVLRISLVDSNGDEVVGTDLTTTATGSNSSSAAYSSNVTLTPTSSVTGYKVALKTKNSNGTCVDKVTREVVASYSKFSTTCCATKVTLSGGSPENGTVTFAKSKLPTCYADKTVKMTITPAPGYQLHTFSVATGDGKVATKSMSASPELDNNSSSAQEIDLTFAEDANGAYNVTATFSEQTVMAWSWTEHVGGGAVSDPLVVYIGQKVQLDVSYTPSTIINAHKSYTRTHGNGDNTYITTTIAQNYCTVKGNRATAAETLTLQHSDDPSGNFAKVVNVEVRALPTDKFLDLVHGVGFDDQSATLTNSDYDVEFTYTAPGGDQDEWSTPYANTCEQKKVKLVGWVESEYADACIAAESFPDTDDLTDEDGELFGSKFFPVGADMTAANKTYYAVWAEKE